MKYSEDDLLPLSALQHLLFCERQCALIHIEQAWTENRLTAEGRIMHEKVHDAGEESRGDVKIVRGLRLRSLRLGLTGVADVVEFRRVAPKLESQIANERLSVICDQFSVITPASAGVWQPFPVEYKRGKPKKDDSDKVQLCAQAMCLEEMLNCSIPAGALFYGTTRRRLDVELGKDLRTITEDTARRLHELFDSGITPPAVYEKKCDSCSLLNQCLPKTSGRGKSARSYLQSVICDL